MTPQNNAHLAPALGQPNDPNIPQKKASNPEASVWVNASAGTGKTKVLTDRVLRLLLPNADGSRRASEAMRILCITFTKAAASEMATRINKILAAWAVLPDAQLFKDLTELLDAEPSELQIKTARRLFSEVIDAPGGLKIMTIHAFCQSVLGRFPLEANIPPNFSVIDEDEAKKLVNSARRKILAPERLNKEPEMAALMANLSAEKNESQVNEVLMNVLSERLQLRRTLHDIADKDALFSALCDELGCPEDITISLDDDALWALARTFQNEGGKKEQGYGAEIQRWLEMAEDQRIDNFHTLIRAFFTDKGAPYANMPTKALDKAQPHLKQQIADFITAISAIGENLKNNRSAALTADLLYLGHYVLDEYKRQKELLGVLDYEDLIFKTHDLLKAPETARWVLFKLDGGLDHLLIDEAQDTNPEQWDIVDTLCTEFFAGYSARDQVSRTIFTVGDEKQSIYSFQRADPDAYQKMRSHFRSQIQHAEKQWEDIDMVTSFRSTESVLNLVDACFDTDELRPTLGPSYEGQSLKHFSFRDQDAGRTEIWPVIEPTEDKEKPEGWQLPLEIKHSVRPDTQLAERIAQEVKSWLRDGRILPSKGRPIHAGDILILVKSRSKIVASLMRAFKKYNVPVAGADRLILSEQIAIMDLLALAQISILPEDDLSLACALKSPFIGLSEDQLFDLGYNRDGKSLWQCLKNHKDYAHIVSWVNKIARIARKERPYEFFSVALNTPCPSGQTGLAALTSRLGSDIDEPISEFLNLSIQYEQDNLPSVQGFLNWFTSRDATVKRQMEEAGREIRIMTVHGAKGLQAPIVFMPDTLQGKAAPREDENLLWPSRTGYEYPLYAPRSKERSAHFTAAKDHIDARSQAEYNRLLYVALTRAEDELYICAAGKPSKSNRDSWYHIIEDGFHRLGGFSEGADGRLIFSAPQRRAVENKSAPDDDAIAAPQDMQDTAWIFSAPPEEPLPPRPLAPSRPSEDEPALNSPLEADNSHRFLRGNITHKLLELLPSLSAEQRQNAAEIFVNDLGRSLSDIVKNGIIRETLAVLNHADFAPVFGAGSMAEVPITGLINNQVISAQIDRMVVTENEILIVDFKTNRPSPKNVKDVPQIYKKQLKAYQDVMAKIYPNHNIRTALLWTDRADLMEIV